MYISDLPEGQDVKLIIMISKEIFEFDSKVCKSYNSTNRIAINGIKKDGKILNFDASKNNLIVKREGQKPLIFRDVKISNVQSKHETFHIVSSNQEAESFNRRESFRVSIDKPASIQIGQNTFDCCIKDLSEKGYAFVIKDAPKLDIGSPVVIKFEDSLVNDTRKWKFTILGEVVRFYELEEVRGQIRTLFGCKIVHPNSKIQQYTTCKQREQLQRSRSKF